MRLGSTRAGAHVRLVCLHRHLTPAEASLSLLCDDGFHDGDALRSLGLDPRKENQPGAEAPFCGQLHTKFPPSDLIEKTPRQSGENAAAIAGVGLTTARAAMIHVFEHLNGIEHNLMARHALHIGNKPNATAILLVDRIV